MNHSTESTVFCLQLLCPSRHAILATLFDSQDTTYVQAEAFLEGMRLKLHLNDWCGICGSHDLTYDLGRTKFASLADAMSASREIAQQNVRTRELLDALGVSFDVQQQGPVLN